MFCHQCEQTARGIGCDISGVCGKKPEVAALQDLLLYGLKGLSIYAEKARQAAGTVDEEISRFTIEGLFSTVTNVNFDPARLEVLIKKCYQLKERARALYEQTWKAKNGTDAAKITEGPAAWVPATDLAGLIRQGEGQGVNTFHENEDIKSAIEILTYGLKGMAAYADHAAILGKKDEEIFVFIHRALAATADKSLGLMDFVGLAMECGKLNLKTMELLSQAHTERFGHPTPTSVSLGTRAGKAILISGHDLLDLEELLKQTEGKGIYVYTHGEMLPAHGYPGLKKYAHLAGNYGGAWQDQQKEFAQFPGAILMTTNCIQRPAESYVQNIFTSGLVAWPGVQHIRNRDFSPVIKRALELPGFAESPGKQIMVGFGHQAVLSVADKVIEAVKGGAIRHFFLIGGCDGAKSGRNYYTDFAEKAPKDSVILTLACGKYRFNKLDFGDIGGIPRLLDVGQCNDAYSAVQIAQALAGAFGVGVNDLPLSLILSWYEQKAVAILLSLLSLGIKNIRLGPSLPAFVSPNVLKFLVEQFNISPISTAEADLKAILK
ncbi:MAG TPA: hydroxylamine reductase [Candidatus Methylomirabilis sp.]